MEHDVVDDLAARERGESVCDRPGEVLYLRDADDGVLLAPTALPIRDEARP